jgi:hypothetical protein
VTANQSADQKCNERRERTRYRKPRRSGHSEREKNDVPGHVCREYMSEAKVTYRVDQSRDSRGNMKQ